jgi:hypothetical protein
MAEEISALIQRASSFAIAANDVNRSLPDRQVQATIAGAWATIALAQAQENAPAKK